MTSSPETELLFEVPGGGVGWCAPPAAGGDGEGVWLSSPDGPVAGRLFAPPDARAGIGILSCAPIGLNGVAAQHTMRRLARRAAAAGALVLAVDYPGTGDSAGVWTDDFAPSRAIAAIAAGADLLRERGVSGVALVGMSGGALLAAAACRAARADHLLLWDPEPGGVRLLRGESALATVSGLTATTAAGLATGSAAETGVRGPGYHYSPLQVTEISGLDLGAAIRRAGLPAADVVVLARPRSAGAAVRKALTGLDVQWAEALGQETLLGISPALAQVPEASLAVVLERLAAWSGPPSAVDVRLDRRPAEVAPGVHERWARVGAAGLFAVIVEPAAPVTGAVVFLPTATEHCLGPAGSWVTLSRRLAGVGVSSLRLDLRGAGDSPPVPGTLEPDAYPTTAVPDIAEALRVFPAQAGRVGVVGLCSGAFHALGAGLETDAGAVCAVNPVSSLVLSPGASAAGRSAYIGAGPRLRQLAGTRVARAVEPRLPQLVWWLLDRLRVLRSPAAPLVALVDRGSRLLLLCGDDEMEPYETRSRLQVRRLRRRPGVTITRSAGLDHALLAEGPRTAALASIEAFCAPRELPR